MRGSWNINRAALEKLGRVVESPRTGDLKSARAEVCREFLANNPPEGNLEAPSRLDALSAVEARFEAKQHLFIAYVSDVVRSGAQGIAESYELSGVQSCLTNGIDAVGSDTAFLLGFISEDKALPVATTSAKEYSLKDTSVDIVRTSYVTVSVEGQAPADVWRRYVWNEDTKDWDITNEQTENPYNLGWKGL